MRTPRSEDSGHERGIDVAVKAFRETLERFEPGGPELALEDAAEIGSRAALLAMADDVWRRHLGTLLSTNEVQQLIGVRTRQAVSDLVKRGRLLALTTRQGRLQFPAFQFTAAGRPHAELKTILGIFAEASASPYTIASWFNTPQGLLRNATPVEWLKAGRDPDTVRQSAQRVAAQLRG